MSDDKGGKKISCQALAYMLLLKDRVAANPDYKASDLDTEIAQLAESLGAKAGKK
jgi:hypothetical protein